MTEPIESLVLDVSKTPEPSLRAAQGATVLEYETTIPTKFMIGTEQGTVIQCNRKGKTQAEKIAAIYQAHLGQVKQVRYDGPLPKLLCECSHSCVHRPVLIISPRNTR